MTDETLSAVLETREVTSEADDGPFHVTLLRRNGTVANTGCSFATKAEARAFVAGLDMAARLFDSRAFLDEIRPTLSLSWPVERPVDMPLGEDVERLVAAGYLYVADASNGWRRIGLTPAGQARRDALTPAPRRRS
jgi:hypothetical protein